MRREVNSLSQWTEAVFKDFDVSQTTFSTNMLVSADKATNNIDIISQMHYIDGFLILLDLDSSQGNPSYTATMISSKL